MKPSPDKAPAIEPLPPALSSMWRLCKLGYRHEPRLMIAALVVSQLAALPDALLALWLMLLGKGVLEHRTAFAARRGGWLGRLGRRHLVSAHRQHPCATPLPRSRNHCTRISRRATASHRRHHRASGTSRISRSPAHASQPGVRARSHVHVGIFHAGMDSASRCDHGAARVHSSGTSSAW